MARRIRLWEKKRGERTTGSPRLGGIGEVALFAGFLLSGLILLVSLIALQLEFSTPSGLYFSGWGLWLMVALVAVFILVGGVGVVYAVVRVSASAERRSAIGSRKSDADENDTGTRDDFPAIPGSDKIQPGTGIRLSYRLPLAHSPAGQLLILALFCLVCVTLASASVALAAAHHIDGDPLWGITALAVPAAAAGVWSVYLFVRRLLIYTNVGPTTLEISDHPLRPGRRYRLYFSQSGRLMMQTFEIWLICRESATYQDGTDSRTERLQVFERQVFVDEELPIRPGEPFEQECEFELTETAMHTFQSKSNSVHWSLVVYGKAPPWPLFERRFPVIVLPVSARESVA